MFQRRPDPLHERPALNPVNIREFSIEKQRSAEKEEQLSGRHAAHSVVADLVGI
jgi:hypothetical protein